MSVRTRVVSLLVASAAHLAIALAMIWFLRKLSDVELDWGQDERREVACVLNAEIYTADTGAPAGTWKSRSLCLAGYTGVTLTTISSFVLTVLLVRCCFPCSGNGQVIRSVHCYSLMASTSNIESLCSLFPLS